MGSQGRVSEVLNGKRALSKEMIRRLHAGGSASRRRCCCRRAGELTR